MFKKKVWLLGEHFDYTNKAKNKNIFGEGEIMKSVTVQTHANVSLNKYWGKRCEELFLPTKSSLTVSLAELKTRTTLSFHDGDCDEIIINWKVVKEESRRRIVSYLNLFRKQFGIDRFFTVETENLFPTAAGLASSSSGFAALALALNELCCTGLSKRELSVLARRGSGSASRSINGGFVLWHVGSRSDGTDCFAEQIYSPQHWPDFKVLVAVAGSGPKPVSSREGMRMTVKTCLSYWDWIDNSAKRLRKLVDAIGKKDFNSVGQLALEDWAGMHRCMLETTPKLDYWLPVSHQIMDAVHNLRKQGVPVFYSTEAGPNVKIFYLQEAEDTIKNELKKITGIQQVIESTIADNPHIITREG